MPIPESTLPGHQAIHQRVITALELLEESISVEFKESGSWQTLQYKIIKNALAMSNLRDGGITVIGVSSRNNTWTIEGITNDHLNSYDPDDVAARINTFGSPHVEVTLLRVRYDNKWLLAIYAKEFQDIPIVCKRNGEDGLIEGAIYLRLPAPPRMSRLMNALQMHDLIDLAAEKKARRLLEQARRVGLQMPPADDVQFDEELEGL